MTQCVGLIGHPLKHSISPEFQQAAFDYYKLDVRYEKWDTEAKNLPSVITQLRQPYNLGANVTVPYKEAVLQFMDEVDELANTIGAVNTIAKQGSKLKGLNTDAYGFINSLRADAEFEPARKQVLILGAGGAARAVSFALVQKDIGCLIIANRTQPKAKALADSLKEYCSTGGLLTQVIAVPLLSGDFSIKAYESQLIVNCTTAGMKYSFDEKQSLLPADAISRDALVYDLVSNPSETPLLKIAREAGARTLGGLSMLVYQGAASFEIWTGKKAPVDIMLSTAKQALLKGGL